MISQSLADNLNPVFIWWFLSSLHFPNVHLFSKPCIWYFNPTFSWVEWFWINTAIATDTSWYWIGFGSRTFLTSCFYVQSLYRAPKNGSSPSNHSQKLEINIGLCIRFPLCGCYPRLSGRFTEGWQSFVSSALLGLFQAGSFLGVADGISCLFVSWR